MILSPLRVVQRPLRWIHYFTGSSLAARRRQETNSSREGLRALTAEEFERAAACLRNPAPGSRIAEAKRYGIDLTLLIEQLRLTPAERGAKLERRYEVP
jgi:hypothetical protein